MSIEPEVSFALGKVLGREGPLFAHDKVFLRTVFETMQNEIERLEDAQRKSWVIGEFMIEHPDVTREYADAVYSKVNGTE